MGTLRWALLQANARPVDEETTIQFDLPAPIAPIRLLSNLPDIGRRIRIDGSSQMGWTAGKGPVVIVEGKGVKLHGPVVRAPARIHDIALANFPAGGILVKAPGASILGCSISESGVGVNLDAGGDDAVVGQPGRGNSFVGGYDAIRVTGARNATIQSNHIENCTNNGIDLYPITGSMSLIGGLDHGAGNTIVGCRARGMSFGATDFSVLGNVIYAAGLDGIRVYPQSSQVRLGGRERDAGNTIAQCKGDGILFQGSHSTVEGNTISGVRAGIAFTGSHSTIGGNVISSARDDGIVITTDADDVHIGGLTLGAGNVITACGDNGVVVFGGSRIWIEGNFIGTDADGSPDRGCARDGINFQRGVAAVVRNNVIASNRRNGVTAHFGNLLLVGNHIGTGLRGVEPRLGNLQDGVTLLSGAHGCTLTGNVFASNGGNGINVEGATNGRFSDNVIGLAKSLAYALGNRGRGISLESSSTGWVDITGNIIAANHQDGVYAQGGGATVLTIAGNIIGSTTFDGQQDHGNFRGLNIRSSFTNIVVANNTIAHSRGDGVEVLKSAVTLTGNRLLHNEANGVFLQVTAPAARLAGNRFERNRVGVFTMGPQTRIKENTFVENDQGLLVSPSATNCSVANNVFGGNAGAQAVSFAGAFGDFQGNWVGVAPTAPGPRLTGHANANVGVVIAPGSRGTTISGNLFGFNNGTALVIGGTDVWIKSNFFGADGRGNRFPNGLHGLEVSPFSERCRVEDNTFAGNHGSGVVLNGGVGTVLLGNLVDGNQEHGVSAASDRAEAQVGSAVSPDKGNAIKNNGIFGVARNSAAITILFNSIHSNGRLGIHTDEGVGLDAPFLTQTNSTHVFGLAPPSADAFPVLIQVFHNRQCHNSSFGEGDRLVGQQHVFGAGQRFALRLNTTEIHARVDSGDAETSLSATATDDRYTSAFSSCLGYSRVPLPCGGCVCRGTVVDCRNRGLRAFPLNLSDTTTALVMAANDLRALEHADPSGILARLTRLQELDLSNTNLRWLPPIFRQGLPALRTLKLRDNQLTSLDGLSLWLFPRLDRLDVANNKIRVLPPKFLEGARPTEVNLRNNGLREIGPGQLGGAVRLQVLDIAENDVETVASGAFGGNNALETIDLQGSSAAIAAPPSVFGSLLSLTAVHWPVPDGCPDGFAVAFATSGLRMCLRCPAGTHKPAGPGSMLECRRCPAGETDHDGDAVTACVACPRGHHSVEGSLGPCNTTHACPAGTLDHDESAKTPCLPCPPGTYEPPGAFGNRSCSACASDHTDDDLRPATPCVHCDTRQETAPIGATGPCVAIPFAVQWTDVAARLPVAVLNVPYAFTHLGQANVEGSTTGVDKYEAQGLPCGMAIDGPTGAVSGRPLQAGRLTVSIRAFDRTGRSALVNSVPFVFVIQECRAKETCGGHGTCELGPSPYDGDFRCVCDPGFIGLRCETQVPSIVPFAVSWDDHVGGEEALPEGVIGRAYDFQGPDAARVRVTGGQVAFYDATNLPCGVRVDNSTGSLSGVAGEPGSFPVRLLAEAQSGGSVFVNDRVFTLVVRDCDAETCNGGTCVDEVPFDAEFSCDCSGSNRTGTLCDVELPPASSGATADAARTMIFIAAGSAVAAVLVVLVVVLVVRQVRARREQKKPFDFDDMLDSMKSRGLVVDTQSSDVAVRQPRELQRKSVAILEKLGNGAFGDVYKGLLDEQDSRGTPAYAVAVKTLKDESVDAKEDILQEAALMAQFSHANVLALIGVCTRGKPVMLVVPLCGHGALVSFLQRLFAVLTMDAKLAICGDVARGMAYLAGRKFVHRDLAARNVLVADDFTCKVADFGMSRDLCEHGEYYKSVKSSTIPVKWTAVEALEERRYTEQSDVWSFGILCYEVFTGGQTPYHEVGNNEMVWMRVKSGYRLPAPPGCPEEIYNGIMRPCWAERPGERPSFARLVDFLRERTTEHGLRGQSVELRAAGINSSQTSRGSNSWAPLSKGRATSTASGSSDGEYVALGRSAPSAGSTWQGNQHAERQCSASSNDYVGLLGSRGSIESFTPVDPGPLHMSDHGTKWRADAVAKRPDTDPAQGPTTEETAFTSAGRGGQAAAGSSSASGFEYLQVDV